MLSVYAKSFMTATRTNSAWAPQDTRHRPALPDPERPRLRKL